jgi:hypothetical protein
VVDLSGYAYEWISSGGVLAEQSDAGDTIMLSSCSSQATDYAITVRAKSAAQFNNLVGIVFGYQGPSDYYGFLWNDPTNHYGEAKRQLVHVQRGSIDILAEDSGIAMVADAWYELKVEASNQGIVASVNGEVVLNYNAASPELRDSGLRSFDNDGGVSYDDYVISIAGGS